VDVHVPKDKVQATKDMLMKNNIQFGIMVNDVEALLNEEEASNYKNAFATYFDYGKYNQWSDVRAYLIGQNLVGLK